MTLPEHVTIVEVGPRDGLQNEAGVVPTDVKVEFVDRLSRTGVGVIEVTSFVHPRWVPQLADGAEVLRSMTPADGIRYPVLVPNERGLNNALEAGVRDVAVFAAASEAFSQRNLNRSIDGSLEMFAPVVRRAAAEGLRVRGYVSMAWGCPYQGDVPIGDVARVSEALVELGCDEICLGDTIGVGAVGQVHRVIDEVAPRIGMERVAVHMHDTYGQGLANTLAAFEAGVRTADTSAGGLGGCPYAKGAKGNLATEDLVYALDRSGVHTGIDLEAVLDTTAWMAGELGRPPVSRVAEAILASRATDTA